MATTTEHEVAVFEREDGQQIILVWIDQEDIETFEDEYSEEEWQEHIEQHPFVQERNLPVVIAFEGEEGSPRLFGAEAYVNSIADDFDWDSINWTHKLTLNWDGDEEGDE